MDTFNKKELEKKKEQKRKEKEARKAERKANAKTGQSLEDMLAYVDENGNITSTPPDESKKKTIRAEEIVTGSRNTGSVTNSSYSGKIVNFNTAKGYGFIRDSRSGDKIFFHVSALNFEARENDNVTFEIHSGPKGPAAGNVKLA